MPHISERWYLKDKQEHYTYTTTERQRYLDSIFPKATQDKDACWKCELYSSRSTYSEFVFSSFFFFFSNIIRSTPLPHVLHLPQDGLWHRVIFRNLYGMSSYSIFYKRRKVLKVKSLCNCNRFTYISYGTALFFIDTPLILK